jgi:hypothetical protein
MIAAESRQDFINAGDCPMSEAQSVLGNGLKLVSEAVVPGASEMLEGHIGSGLLHTALAIGATSLLGGVPVLAGIAALAVRANSYSRSVNGQNLFGGTVDRAVTAVEGAVGRPGPAPKSS